MITTKGAKIKVKDITNICYGICIFLFVIGQSYLLSSSAILATLCQGLKIVAATVPVLVLLRHSKFSIRNLLLWGLIALLIIGNIFFNQADSDLIYIVIFILYCSKAEPESVLKTYCISAGIAIAIVIFAWLIGILPSQTSAGREYLGFYFATFGPNLFLHTVLAYIASRKNKIKFRSWILIEVINVWFYKMTDTLAVFVVINASIILYYLLNIEKIKQFLFDRDFPRRILEIFPFFSAIATIVAQYFYIAHYNEPAFVAKPVGHYNFKKHLKAIVIFFAMSCATTIYTHLDTVMLGFIRTDADVGYYNAAVKIKTILVSIVTSLGVVLLPRASYYVEHSMMDEFYRITKKAINFVFLIATPMMIYFMLFAKEGVFFLSGDAYAGAIIPMQVIMPTLLFIGLTNIMGIQMLVPLGKEKVVLYSEIAGMIVDIILNALLIPKMASTGAAIGTLAAEIAVFIVQYVALRGIIKEAYRQVHYVAIGSSVLAGGVLAVLIKRMQWGSFMTLCASAIVFFGVYFLILTIAKESLVIEIENQLLGRIIKKK